MIININNRITNKRTNRIREHPLDVSIIRSQEPPVWRDILSLLLKIAGICVIFILAFTFLYGLHRNEDSDMSPMIKDGDLVMFYRLDQKYSIGELFLLEFQGKRQIRRVVAKAGDTVDITESGLIVNGAIQQEAEIYQKTMRYANDVAFPLILGPDEVFFLGDSRKNATDSRVYGPVNIKNTLGKVIAIMRRRNL